MKEQQPNANFKWERVEAGLDSAQTTTRSSKEKSGSDDSNDNNIVPHHITLQTLASEAKMVTATNTSPSIKPDLRETYEK